MPPRARRPVVAALIGFGAVTSLVTSIDAAAARSRHRHHARHVERQFVFPTPEAARQAVDVGEFGGDTLAGIPGATTADPYQRPALGYNQNGVYGAGYAYPGY